MFSHRFKRVPLEAMSSVGPMHYKHTGVSASQESCARFLLLSLIKLHWNGRRNVECVQAFSRHVKRQDTAELLISSSPSPSNVRASHWRTPRIPCIQRGRVV